MIILKPRVKKESDVFLDYEVLRGLLFTDNAIEQRSILASSFFTTQETQEIFDFIINYYDKYASLPVKEILINELGKDNTGQYKYQEIVSILFSKKPVFYKYALDKIIDFAQERNITTNIEKSLSYLRNDQIDKSLEHLSIASQKVKKHKKEDHFFVKNWDDRKKQLLMKDSLKPPMPTGMGDDKTSLDVILDGGLFAGELGAVMALWKTGKSIFLMNLGYNAWQLGYNVMHVVLEGSLELLTRRYEARSFGISSSKLKARDISSVELENADFLQKKVAKSELYLCRFPAYNGSITDIKSKFLSASIDFDLLIVDYGDLMQPIKNYREKRFQIDSVFWDLKNFAEDFNIPIWTATQAGAVAEKRKRLQGSDTSESKAKNQILDLQLGLSPVDEVISNVLKLTVLFRRDGQRFDKDIFLSIDRDLMKIY